MPACKDSKLRALDELETLIDRFIHSQSFYFRMGYLNSEGRKLLLRVSALASTVFTESRVNAKVILGDCSDLHVLAKLQDLSQMIRDAKDCT